MLNFNFRSGMYHAKLCSEKLRENTSVFHINERWIQDLIFPDIDIRIMNIRFQSQHKNFLYSSANSAEPNRTDDSKIPRVWRTFDLEIERIILWIEMGWIEDSINLTVSYSLHNLIEAFCLTENFVFQKFANFLKKITWRKVFWTLGTVLPLVYEEFQSKVEFLEIRAEYNSFRIEVDIRDKIFISLKFFNSNALSRGRKSNKFHLVLVNWHDINISLVIIIWRCCDLNIFISEDFNFFEWSLRSLFSKHRSVVSNHYIQLRSFHEKFIYVFESRLE